MPKINMLVSQLAVLLQQRHLRCAVAESCTGGGLAAALTELPGSSTWFDRGFVTYSNASKHEMLNVPNEVIVQQGAVSEATVCAMAEGALLLSAATLSMAISGIAGPDGGSPDKPVGTVWIAWAFENEPTRARCYLFKGDRSTIRQQAVVAALENLMNILTS